MATRRSKRLKIDATNGTAENPTFRKMLLDFYKKNNPKKVDDVDGLLKKYRGREVELFERLVKKYNANPSVFCLDEAQKPNAEAAANQESQNSAVDTGLAFGVSSTRPKFGSSGVFKGFGSVTSSNTVQITSFTAPADSLSSFSKVICSSFTASKSDVPSFRPPATSFSAIAKKSSSFAVSSSLHCTTKESAPTFVSLTAPKTVAFGTVFGSSFGQTAGIRSKSSFDSDAMEGMDCD